MLIARALAKLPAKTSVEDAIWDREYVIEAASLDGIWL